MVNNPLITPLTTCKMDVWNTMLLYSFLLGRTAYFQVLLLLISGRETPTCGSSFLRRTFFFPTDWGLKVGRSQKVGEGFFPEASPENGGHLETGDCHLFCFETIIFRWTMLVFRDITQVEYLQISESQFLSKIVFVGCLHVFHQILLRSSHPPAKNAELRRHKQTIQKQHKQKPSQNTWVPPNHHVFFRDVSSWWLSHPFEKYARQIGSSPQVGMKITHVWNHHLGIF